MCFACIEGEDVSTWGQARNDVAPPAAPADADVAPTPGREPEWTGWN